MDPHDNTRTRTFFLFLCFRNVRQVICLTGDGEEFTWLCFSVVRLIPRVMSVNVKESWHENLLKAETPHLSYRTSDGMRVCLSQSLLVAQQLANAVGGVMSGAAPGMNQPILIPFSAGGHLGGQQGLVLSLPTANIQSLVAAAAAGGIMTLPLQNLQGKNPGPNSTPQEKPVPKQGEHKILARSIKVRHLHSRLMLPQMSTWTRMIRVTSRSMFSVITPAALCRLWQHVIQMSETINLKTDGILCPKGQRPPTLWRPDVLPQHNDHNSVRRGATVKCTHKLRWLYKSSVLLGWRCVWSVHVSEFGAATVSLVMSDAVTTL